MSVSKELVDLLLATRFWPNLAQDRELQVRGESDEVFVSYGGEDLFIFGTDSGRLTCRTRPRLVPIRPEVFHCRGQNAWVPLMLTPEGSLEFESIPEVIALGDANPETIAGYKLSVQRSGLWDWRKLIVECGSSPDHLVVADRIRTQDDGKLAELAVIKPGVYEVTLIHLIHVSILLDPSDWFTNYVQRSSGVIRQHADEIVQAIKSNAALLQDLGVSTYPPLLSSNEVRLSPMVEIHVGACSHDEAHQIATRTGRWEWLAEVFQESPYDIRPVAGETSAGRMRG